MSEITPRRGDIVTVDLNPTRGREQKGIRPALVISHDGFNAKTGTAIVCPITSRVRGGPFEIPVAGNKTSGVILANQVRTVDLAARGVKVCDWADDFSVREVVRKLKLIIE